LLKRIDSAYVSTTQNYQNPTPIPAKDRLFAMEPSDDPSSASGTGQRPIFSPEMQTFGTALQQSLQETFQQALQQQAEANNRALQSLTAQFQQLQASISPENPTHMDGLEGGPFLYRTSALSNNPGPTNSNNPAIPLDPTTPSIPANLSNPISPIRSDGPTFSKDLTKRVYAFPEGSRLTGFGNYEQWLQALSIQLRALGLAAFIADPAIETTLRDSEQAVLLMLIRDSLSKDLQPTINWAKTPAEAYQLLTQQFSRSSDLLRGSLYARFHQLAYQGYRGTLEEFNSEFNSLIARLALLGAPIQPIDQSNQYLEAVKRVFPQWAERQRNTIKTSKILGLATSPLNLQWLIADLLQEQQEEGSSTAKAATYRLNQAKIADKTDKTHRTNQKADKNQRTHRRPYQKDQKRAKNAEKGAKNGTIDPTAATFIIRDSLDELGPFLPSSEDEDDDRALIRDLSAQPDPFIEDLSAMPDPLQQTYFQKRVSSYQKETSDDTDHAKSPTQGHEPAKNRSPLLYDTGSTVHLIRDKAAFIDLKPIPKGEAKPITTAGGPIYPLGIGTARFSVLIALKPAKYRPLVLKNALFYPGIEINIISGVLHVQKSGSIRGARLYSADNTCCGLFYYKEHGFFLQQQGIPTPSQRSSAFVSTLSGAKECYMASRPTKLAVELPAKPPKWALEGDFDDFTSIDPSNQTKAFPNRQSTPDASEPTFLNRKEEEVPPDPIPLAAPPNHPNFEPAEQLPLPSLKDESPYRKLLQIAGIWHVRLGHIGLALLKKTAKLSSDLPDLSPIREADFHCVACIKAKTTRRPSREPIPDPAGALDIIEGDTFTLSPFPIGKRPIGLILVDRKTRYKWVILLPNKEGNTVLAAVQTFLKGIRLHYGRTPKRFHFDGGREINRALQALITAEGTIYSVSSPYIHEQNGLPERAIRALTERLRATIIWSGLPPYLWSEILPGVLALVNATASSTREKSSYSLLLEEINPKNCPNRPSFQPYRAIGARCLVLIPPERRIKAYKLASRTEEGRLLRTLGRNTYIVYIPRRRAILQTSFLRIIEGIGPILQGLPPINTPLEGDNSGEITVDSREETMPRQGPVRSDQNELSDPIDLTDLPMPNLPNLPIKEGSNQTNDPSADASVNDLPNKESQEAQIEPQVDPSNEENSDPMDLTNPLGHYLFLAHQQAVRHAKKSAKKAKKPLNGEPNSFKEVLALSSPLKDRWLEAIFSEFRQLIRSGTFIFKDLADLPAGRKTLKAKLVLKEKRDQHGTLQKLKARLVAKGFMQVQGLDYSETFAVTTIPPT
jgi:hypothetical protein